MTQLTQIAVIGNPISQSLSPKMHNFLLKKYAIDGFYIPLKIEEENFEQMLKDLAQIGFKGFNITIPFKENALKICDKLSNSAQEIGAVNTILIMEDGKIFGHNSDGIGFVKNIQNSHPDFNFNNKEIILIGAGGSAKAISYALINKNVKKITIFNRNLENAQNLTDNLAKINPKITLEVKALDQINDNLQNCDLLINSTSLGMVNNPALDIDLTNISKSAIISDIVYKPLMTPLLTQAQSLNLKIVTGIGMLIFQGLVGFELWFGQKNFNKDDIKELEKLLLF
ncbi:shikimate dehydrogenase [Rickettsiales bacterium]|nr:shikimate dehydrogenase [Rickettsiales bacterium]